MCNYKVPCPSPTGVAVMRPCGKCLDCLRRYQQDWTCRLSEEFKAWQDRSIIFFTLTYSDENLPLMVTYNHPITLNSYQVLVRNSSFPFLRDRLSRLGLDSFLYTRSLKENTYKFRKEREVLQSTYLDLPEFERPSLVVPTCNYSDVNKWIRYCRKYFERHELCDTFDGIRVNPFLKDLSFKNIHGLEHKYPKCAYTSSFKYWITSEYGPSTLRPHYHGVLMGVSEEMFRDVFAPYWREHFGSGSLRSVVFSVYDPSKGGAMYISKYCSKGSFDHPLVSRSIHYPSGKEYFSKSFIHCLSWFGFDMPLCVPPFRLISKGIGIRYPFDASVQNYWGIQCDESTNFVCKDKDLKVVPLSFLNGLPLSDVNLLTVDSALDSVGTVPTFTNRYKLTHFSSDGRFLLKTLSSTDFVVDPSLSESDFISFQDSIFNKKYFRTYFYDGSFRTYSSLLPKYYKRFLLSPFSQIAVNDSIKRLSNDDSYRKRMQVKSFRCQDQKDAFLRQITHDSSIKRSISQAEIAFRYGRFYSKIFKGDMI